MQEVSSVGELWVRNRTGVEWGSHSLCSFLPEQDYYFGKSDQTGAYPPIYQSSIAQPV